MSLSSSFSVFPLLLVGLLAVPMGCTHTVRIKSEPAGAEIFVNGQSQGKSPVTYTETSSGGGTVEVKAKLNGQEVTQQVPKSEINWAAVGGGGIGGGAGACLALNAAGSCGFFIIGPFAWALNCLGFAALVGIPLGVYFAAGQQMKEDITITMPTTAGPAPTPNYGPPPVYTPPMDGTPPAANQSY